MGMNDMGDKQSELSFERLSRIELGGRKGNSLGERTQPVKIGILSDNFL